VWVDIGADPADPVLLISDLAPHVDRDFRGRTQQEVFRTEELNPIIATMPPDVGAGQRSPTDRLLAVLQDKYGITARDLLTAEIQIVTSVSIARWSAPMARTIDRRPTSVSARLPT
jgi:aspartyl aminopeptidase